MMRAETRLRVMSRTVLAVLVSFGVLASRGIGQSQGAANRNPALLGAIDFHVHELPDSENWRIDAIEMARDAVSRGMRGAVLRATITRPPKRRTSFARWCRDSRRSAASASAGRPAA